MIIETILVILGVLTTALGIWNIIIGAYIWGTLFLLGGIWAIVLGTLYIIQIRKEKKKYKKKKATPTSRTTEEKEESSKAISAEDLFNEAPKVILAGTSADIEEEPKKSNSRRKKSEKEKLVENEETVDAINIVEIDEALNENRENAKVDENEKEETTNYLSIVSETGHELIPQENENTQLVVVKTEKELDETNKEE